MASNIFTTNKMKLEEKSWVRRNFKALTAATALLLAGIGTFYYMNPSLTLPEVSSADTGNTQAKSPQSNTLQPAFANTLKTENQGLQGKRTDSTSSKKFASKGHESLKVKKSSKHKDSKYSSHKKHKGGKYSSHKKHKGGKVVGRKLHGKRYSQNEVDDSKLFDL